MTSLGFLIDTVKLKIFVAYSLFLISWCPINLYERSGKGALLGLLPLMYPWFLSTSKSLVLFWLYNLMAVDVIALMTYSLGVALFEMMVVQLIYHLRSRTRYYVVSLNASLPNVSSPNQVRLVQVHLITSSPNVQVCLMYKFA